MLGKDAFHHQLSFLMMIDEIMRRVTQRNRRGIECGPVERLEDLVFADDYYVYFHRYYFHKYGDKFKNSRHRRYR